MEMKLIFSLIETGALPASFLGITNLSFLFYSPPRCKSKVIEILTCIAVGLRSTADNIDTPCSVKT